MEKKIKEILYNVGLEHKQTGKKLNLEVWAEDCDKATNKVIGLIGYDGRYSWTGTSPIYENNLLVYRLVEKQDS